MQGQKRNYKNWCSLGLALCASSQALLQDPKEAILAATHQGALQLAGLSEVPAGINKCSFHPFLCRPKLPGTGFFLGYFPGAKGLNLQLATKGGLPYATLV